MYGPKQDPRNPYSGVISIFIERLSRNQPVTVNGGRQTRDFIFVVDVAATMYKSMTHLQATGGHSVFNVGTGKSVTINALLDTLANLLGKEPQVHYKPLPPGDPSVSLGSSEKMAQELSLDIEQFASLEAGLARTIEYAARSGDR